MEWLLIFLLITIAVVSYVLFAPFYLEINTSTGLCSIRFHHLASAKLIISDRSLLIDLWIAGWAKQIDLFAKTVTGKEKSNQSLKKKKRFKISFNKVKAVVKSFKVTKCYLTMDTGNVELNGVLYPCFYWLSNAWHVCRKYSNNLLKSSLEKITR
ncbi:MAG: hypothetical protein JWQ63_4415 [Mucilaginibacter sp.]|jgi:hypothetical protein|nr:hypothetical protein [Mucilaginibacter sp.]